MSPYAHLRQYVVSATLPPGDDPEGVADDPLGLARRLKQQPGSGVGLAGGGRLAGALLCSPTAVSTDNPSPDKRDVPPPAASAQGGAMTSHDSRIALVTGGNRGLGRSEA